MAVEARHLNIFASQLNGNREMTNRFEDNVNGFNNAVVMGCGLPLVSGTTTETLLPFYNNSAMKSDSSLTNVIPPVARKRTRDSKNSLVPFPNGHMQNQSENRCTSFTFLGEDVSLQMLQQQLEIDRFIAQHKEKVRLEMEESRKRYSMSIVAALEERVLKRLRVKEEEIEKVCKLNWALEERVKSLCIENQIWRDMARTNEAAADALRCNIEQVLAHVNKEEQQKRAGASDREVPATDLMDDAQSCCDSNYGGIKQEMLTLAGGERECVKDKKCIVDCVSSSGCNDRLCRHCGNAESCVLLLPCRHLCLCAVCGSSVYTCPICNAVKNASLHVIMFS